RGALFGKASGKTVLYGLDHRVPWEGISPQANGVALGDKLGGLEVRTTSDEPMLQVAHDTHGGLSFLSWGVRASEYDERRSETTPEQRVEELSAHYLLAIQLMPRIRHWKHLTLYAPSKRFALEQIEHLRELFSDTIAWTLIKMHL